ncbi:MAG TPA: SRPBCC domain-containing protein [Candidatus Binataceae bacterium]|nr:SRPBCC domain-containing protein [Candidatus Binataceae bacterium]
MAGSSSAAVKSADLELVITRIFDAPRNLVWKAWAEPDRMVRWMGPRGFTGDIVKMDGRPGGSYRFHMRSPDGADHWAQGVYREVIETERLVYTWSWADADGNPTPPETLITVTFADQGEKTKLTLRQAGFESQAARDGHNYGWSSSFDCLAEYLATA